MILNSEIEKIPLDELNKLQWSKIKYLLAIAYQQSSFYKRWFDKHQIDIEQIQIKEDYRRLPCMNKQHLLETDPWDFVACQKEELINVTSSGGTTGKPKIILSTDERMNKLSEADQRVFAAIDLDSIDSMAQQQGFGLPLAARITEYGLKASKILALPVGLGTPWPFSIDLIRRMKISSLWTSSATAVQFTQEVQKLGFNPKNDFEIKKMICSGMPTPKHVRDYLESAWGCLVFRAGGQTETGMLGYECAYRDGMHIFGDQMYWEILNPETHQPVQEGEIGEAVVTPLINLALPLFRYQIDDLVKMTTERCWCGRTMPRIWILGRTAHTVNLPGAIKLETYQIDEALEKFSGLGLDYQIIVSIENNLHKIKLRLEAPPEHHSPDLTKKVSEAIVNSSIDFHEGVEIDKALAIPEVEFLQPGTLERTDRGKLKDKIIDLRTTPNA